MAEERDSRQRLAPTAFLVAGLLALSSAAPVLRDAFAAARLGASGASDAYFLGTYLLLMIVTILVVDSLTPASVVTLSSVDGGDERTGWTLRRAFAVVAVILVAIAGLVALLAGPLVALVAPGFDATTHAMAVDATRAVAPGIVFLGLAWLLTAYLNASGFFLLPAMLTPVVAIGAIIPLAAGTTSPAVAAAGWTLGAGLAFAMLLGSALMIALTGRSRERTVARLDRERAVQLARNASPLLLMVIITQCAEIADRVIPSGIDVGALTTVSLAKKTMILPNTILVVAVGAVTLPYISRSKTEDDRARAFAQTINLAVFFLLPVAAMLALARTDIIQALFGRGQFGIEDVEQTSTLLGAYAFALLPVTLGVVLQRSFATLNRSWAPLLPYSLAMAGYIAGALIGSRLVGLIALPAAFALAEAGYVAALLYQLNRQPEFRLRELLWPTVVAAVGTAAAAGAILSVELLGIGNVWLSLGGKLALAGAVYIAISAWLRHPVAFDLLRYLKLIDGDEARAKPLVAVESTYARNHDGTGRYVLSLIRELERRPDVDVAEFAAPRSDGLPRWLRRWLNGGLHLVWLQVVLPLWAWRRGVSVIHTSMTGPLLAPCPVVMTVHDALDYHPQWRPSALWSAYVRWLGALAARRASAIVTISQAAAAEVSRYFSIEPERLHVVWNGASLLYVPPRPPAVASVLGERYVLVVGSAAPYKNLDTAVAAMRVVRERAGDIELVIAGRLLDDAWREHEWVRLVIDCDDEELAWLYRNASVVCTPSFYEGFGLPVLEALTFGVPIVASDIPALREVGGEAARYAAPERPEEFAERILEILADLEAERRRIAPLSEHASTFTWARMADGVVQVYFSILGNREREKVWAGAASSSS